MYGPGVYPPQPKTVLLPCLVTRPGMFPKEKTASVAPFIPLSNEPAPLCRFHDLDGTSGENCLTNGTAATPLCRPSPFSMMKQGASSLPGRLANLSINRVRIRYMSCSAGFLPAHHLKRKQRPYRATLINKLPALRKVSSNQPMLPLIPKPMLPGQAKFCSPVLL